MRLRGAMVDGGDVVGRKGPPGLSVERFEVGDDEFAVLEWEIATPEAEPACAGLTEAERSVLERVVAGASNAAIARARGSSVRTIANQVASLLRKLGASSRYELVRRFGRCHAGKRAT